MVKVGDAYKKGHHGGNGDIDHIPEHENTPPFKMLINSLRCSQRHEITLFSTNFQIYQLQFHKLHQIRINCQNNDVA